MSDKYIRYNIFQLNFRSTIELRYGRRWRKYQWQKHRQRQLQQRIDAAPRIQGETGLLSSEGCDATEDSSSERAQIHGYLSEATDILFALPRIHMVRVLYAATIASRCFLRFYAQVLLSILSSKAERVLLRNILGKWEHASSGGIISFVVTVTKNIYL